MAKRKLPKKKVPLSTQGRKRTVAVAGPYAGEPTHAYIGGGTTRLPPDREQLEKTLADDHQALMEGKSVLGIAEMADALEALGPAFRVNAKAIRSARATLAAEYGIALSKLGKNG